MLCLGASEHSEEAWERQEEGVCCKGHPGTRRAPKTVAKRWLDLPGHSAQGSTDQGVGLTPGGPEAGTESVVRRAAHPLLGYEGTFWLCITTFEGFPQVLAASCVCPLSFQPPVSPGMYTSLYKRDYQWCKDYQPPNEENMQVQWASPRLAF